MKNDELGQRMKENYENRTRILLPRRTYTIIRLDGKAFHTFTKSYKRPFDYGLMNLMDLTTLELCRQIQGVKFAFTQSDEISLLLTDFDSEKSNSWFDGNIQKITSVSASIATAAFNKELLLKSIKETGHNLVTEDFIKDIAFANFDSRTYTVSDRNEVLNYFIWRQQDATRNSIQMAAQNLYSHSELHGKNTSDLRDMMIAKGVNWNNYPSCAKRGRAIFKVQRYIETKSENPNSDGTTGTFRNIWVTHAGVNGSPETPIFTQDNEFIGSHIPHLSTYGKKEEKD